MTQFISLDRTWNFRRLPPIGAGVGDGWNRVEFPAVETTQLRIEVQLQPDFSGGILEWKVEP